MSGNIRAYPLTIIETYLALHVNLELHRGADLVSTLVVRVSNRR